jgi:hypothetical protein
MMTHPKLAAATNGLRRERSLDYLCEEMLQTLEANYVQGYLDGRDDDARRHLQELMDQWWERLQSIRSRQ